MDGKALWLDRDVERATRWLVDAHVTSSVFEYSMVLTTAVQLNGLERDDLYFTHADHPLAQWAGESFANWRHLHEYTDAAHEEWRCRWDRADDERHGCWSVVQSLDLEAVRGLDWPREAASDPPLLTGDWSAADYVDAYRSYYANDERHLFAWAKTRSEPPWIDEDALEPTDPPDGAT